MTRASILLLLLATAAQAKGLRGDSIVKQAREGDVAAEYELRADGGFFRRIGGRTCQVAADVVDFKIPAHPADANVAYFVKRGALYALPMPRAAVECPRADAWVLVPTLAQVRGEWGYRLLSSGESRVMLLALDGAATLHAIGPAGEALAVTDVADFAVNSCFGVEGKSFSSYGAFAVGRNGYVVKVSGREPASSKTHGDRRYANVSEFTRANRVCL